MSPSAPICSSTFTRPTVRPGLMVTARESGHHHCHVPAESEHRVHLLLESDGGVVRQKRDGLRFEGVRRPGDIVIIPAGSVGHCHCEAHSRGIEVKLAPLLLREAAPSVLETKDWQLSVRFAVRDETLQQLILLLHREAGDRQSGEFTNGDSLMIDSLSTALAVQLLRHHSHVHATTDDAICCELCGGLSLRAQRQVVEYVGDNLEEELRLDDMASVVGLSRYHFLRAFKASMGRTPHQYVVEQRIERAKVLKQFRERESI